ncbi:MULTISPECIES: class D sortase [Bacillus]|uniref:Sortase n=2 Tax=Bacillus TaxID=1386 RepID=A0A0M4FLM6_9BACI|nr:MULTISPECIES: class D sortase [Bacillus]ALC82991.1 sortase [Bacillus gobiensis]MBP1082004.1 sortase A [Bacillus capparidis]MED1096639.1 class D sortase [Bacillus capparidis]
MRSAIKRRRRSKRNKRLLLLSLAAALILFGLWFSGTNAYTFLKGYLLFKTGQVNAEDYKVNLGAANEKEQEQEPLYQDRPEIGEVIGDLIIPKLEAKLPIYHGTDEDELEKGVGHFAGSVLPGEKDNSVLSGHRDTVFRKLGEVGKGDLLVVQTSAGKFTYKVRKVRIVDKNDRTVIVPKPKATLTVSTCYPFDFIGAAPERYILVADLISSEK